MLKLIIRKKMLQLQIAGLITALRLMHQLKVLSTTTAQNARKTLKGPVMVEAVLVVISAGLLLLLLTEMKHSLVHALHLLAAICIRLSGQFPRGPICELARGSPCEDSLLTQFFVAVEVLDEGADFRNYTYAKYGRVVLEQPGQFAWQIWDNPGDGRNPVYNPSKTVPIQAGIGSSWISMTNDGKMLMAMPKAPLPAGGYNVKWQATETGGKQLQGEFSFTAQ